MTDKFGILNEYTIRTQITETYEDFIFEQIQPYCETVMRQKISKKLLIFALTDFKENHPDIWADLTKGESDDEEE